jgi:hypothetical protein
MQFTLLVIANLVAMIGGPPPAWVIYAPLPPLLLLMLSGLMMLAKHYADAGRARRQRLLQ